MEFFVERGHRLVPSAPLVPPDDPTLLFTTAGMVQFKKYYSGAAGPPPFPRACSVQKCLRAGGKGSDLENVGRTFRHLTFFEMLGNFSFGDYFKREAIAWAWEFTTKVLGLPIERLWVTVFRDDDEAFAIWRDEIGILPERIVRMGEKDNFWGPAGDTGACGPCSEIHIDLGIERSKHPESSTLENDSDRFLEFWNLVFPQFDQQLDGSRPPLKYRGIDTGMGLERLCAVVQGVGGPFETDLLRPIVEHAASLMGVKYKADEQTTLACNAVADHARALAFTIAEGVLPSNEGRGYVLRRILRRAIRFAARLGIEQPFIHRLVPTIIEQMGGAWPEIVSHRAQIEKVIRKEEESFHATLGKGMTILMQVIEEARAEGRTLIDGAEVFRLYDTYGFPLDLTREIAQENSLTLDETGFEAALAEQKARARAHWKGGATTEEAALLKSFHEKHGRTEFLGYEQTEADAKVLWILKDAKPADRAETGQHVIVVLDRTPFYGEAGGQVGDTGRLIIAGGEGEATVLDTQKTPEEVFMHLCEVTRGEIKTGDSVTAAVDAERRAAIRRNHTATHLLQGALKRIVGAHITQSGSLVDEHHLRFDFTHIEPLTPAQIELIEETVMGEILANKSVNTETLPIEQARRRGAIAPFGEKYGAVVRLVEVPGFSLEFCGGTHVARTGDIGPFMIRHESSIASGVRRIEALTGHNAARELRRRRALLAEACHALSTKPEDLSARITALQSELKALQRELDELKARQARDQMDALLESAREAGGVKVVTARFDGLSVEALREAADFVRSKLSPVVAVLASVDDGRVTMICAVTKDISGRFHAGQIVKEVAAVVGGGGGGRPDLAQAGGRDAGKLPAALALVPEIVERMAGAKTGKS
ncbi:MAG: alanine--tRNA ligase [Candidatus Sumerlaeia bacterium]